MSILCSLLNLSPHVHSIAAVPICSSKMFSSTRMTSASPGLRSSPASEWLCLIHKALYVFITDTGHVLKVLFSDCSHVNINFPLCMYVCVCVRRIRAGTELTWDYSYEVGSVEGKVLLCCCGSAECTGRLLWIPPFTITKSFEMDCLVSGKHHTSFVMDRGTCFTRSSSLLAMFANKFKLVVHDMLLIYYNQLNLK